MRAPVETNDVAARCLAALLDAPGRLPPEADALADLALDDARPLFAGVVEPLADRFEPSLSEAYRLLFARVVSRARRAPGFDAVDRALVEASLETEADLLERGRRPSPAPPSAPRKAFVLSRVTLGADVAVSSVVLGRLARHYPEAEIVLVGSRKAGELFASSPRVRLAELSYPRGGGLADRLGAWLATRELLARETAGLGPGDFLVVDPDSRLTQLGLLPVASDASYLFFDSRAAGGSSDSAVGELTARWLSDVFGGPCDDRPFVALPAEDLERGRRFREALAKPLAAVNFGFGGNPAKRLDGDFEAQTVLELLRRGYAVALDRGFGDEELARSGAVLAAVEAAGFSPDETLAFQGPLAGFAGYIAAADLFVGYDSACGHLAAALGVPGVDVFSGAVSPRMRLRWRPWGAAPGTVIPVEPGDEPETVLGRLREAVP